DTGEDEPGKSYDKPNLANMTVDWGDGNIDYYSWDSNEENPGGWEEHEYAGADVDEEFNITVQYTDENVNVVNHHYTYGVHQGVWKEEAGDEEDEEGEVTTHGYHTHSVKHGECYLDKDLTSTPSAKLIDRVISEGPIEVITEQIKTSDSNGEVSISVTPTLPGIYLTIVQSRITREGATMTGIGMNAVATTKASVALSGDDLTEMTTMGGIPVYSVTPDSNGLTTLTITPSGVTGDVEGWIGIAPLEMSDLFTDIGEDEWGEEQDAELKFQDGDTSRSTEMRITAPLSLVAVGIIGEDNMPLAVHAGLLLNNPETLTLTGSLGPGQTTTISLADSEASRLLAVAAPQSGFDPASIDFSAFTELLWDEGAKPEINWIAAQKNVDEYCLDADIWYDEWDHRGNVHISLRERHNDMVMMPDFNPSQVVMTDSDGATISPAETEDGEDWSDEVWKGYYNLQHLTTEGSQEYTLSTQSGDVTVVVEKHESDEEGEYHYEAYARNGNTCDRVVDDGELIDRLFDDLGSVAWGQGTSADLRLPVLASPKGQYTVIAIAQKGTGDGASIVAATGSQVSMPNPLPPVIEDLTVGFSPPNPKPGDTVQITVTDPSNQPVDGMSVIVAYADGSATLFSILTDSNGQAEFLIPVGELKVKVSGGMFTDYEMMITVTDSGTVIPGVNDGTGNTNGDDPSGQSTPDTEGNATGSASAAASEGSEGGFVPAPGILLTSLALMGAIFLQRSKDD
ncbi:MAG TPA: carboxypeptidase-like regulatory domain-containing protein, partial [Candidatus Poseidoniales archaeon]|nr:carboxypeptidase-like regulatory domain-containing protein [Candidatus Poseidoniales archaeon]